MSRNELEQEAFYGLGIAPTLLERIEALGFEHPTPIQHKAIPIACRGEDVVGIAQTGTGKTLAFSVPMLQQMSARGKKGLILLPTRELAIQVLETLTKLGSALGLRTALLIGGTNQNPQVKQLRAKPHVIIATPGRLIDMMEQKHANLDQIGVLVLDEADRMLDMGFAPQLKKILAKVPTDRQTMLFSATMPEQIAQIAKQYMKSPLRIEVAPSGTTAERVDQEMFIVSKNEKNELLERLLIEYRGTILVFSRTKHGAKKIARFIRDMGHSAAELHSNRSQSQRQEALKGFSTGKYRVMVATDIAARGIDVKNIELVINFDLPDQLEDYVHRIGRTGRAGCSGKAISFAVPEQKNDILQIERMIKTTLPIKTKTGELITRKPGAQPTGSYGPGPRSRGGGGGGGRRGGGTRGTGGGRRSGGGGRTSGGGRSRHG
ncbi:DEAD/DEAH box helicase [Candidatus Uhrbacteria bacterium]|nr:DEAD/DEAH box helicase [Candidatus Uhrbacteria bacterium]